MSEPGSHDAPRSRRTAADPQSTDACREPADVRRRPTDEGLRCPECRYNLTGIAGARCPECGVELEWDHVRAVAGPAPIAFERARGWRKIPAFFVTAVTVLFAPWIFARQATVRVGAGHALLFGLICFAATPLALLASPGARDVWIAWVVTAAVYLPVQALWLSWWDPQYRGKPRRTWWFWLLLGGYTSAVMLSEVLTGPPMVLLGDVLCVTTGSESGYRVLEQFYSRASSITPWFPQMYECSATALIGWAQVGVWLAGLACCVAARGRRSGGRVKRVLRVVLAALGTFVLYAAAAQYLGVAVWEWVNR
jgi:hypothetical protein